MDCLALPRPHGSGIDRPGRIVSGWFSNPLSRLRHAQHFGKLAMLSPSVW
jgi:hypothetical protein